MPKVLEDLLWCAALGQAEVEGKAKLSNDVLAKIVVIAMLLGALLIWRTSEVPSLIPMRGQLPDGIFRQSQIAATKLLKTG